MQRQLPVSFELKRWLATRQPVFWHSELCRDLIGAPIYMFRSAQLDALDVLTFDEFEAGHIRLPHAAVMFEVGNDSPAVTHSVAWCWASAGTINGLLFLRKSRRLWTYPQAMASLDLETGWWEYELNPEVAESSRQSVSTGLGGVICRGCVALGLTEPATLRIPTAKRKRLERQGVGGFEYRIVDVPEPPKPRAVPQGGTHASPRWHLRRGHWRRVGERRVWVTECEVGDAARGVVVKDYEVAAREGGERTQKRPGAP